MADPDSDDTYWLILEWVEGRTLLDLLEDERPLLFDEQIAILRPLADALVTCHSHGIIHRNLTPSSVYLHDDGTVKLGDFDFARVSAVGNTISKTGVPLTINKYTAQELRSGFRPADARSDLYSIGAIWYDMVLRRPADEPVLLSMIDDMAVPEDARTLLRSLLAPQPQKRPSSAREVVEWFELLA